MSDRQDPRFQVIPARSPWVVRLVHRIRRWSRRDAWVNEGGSGEGVEGIGGWGSLPEVGGTRQSRLQPCAVGENPRVPFILLPLRPRSYPGFPQEWTPSCQWPQLVQAPRPGLARLSRPSFTSLGILPSAPSPLPLLRPRLHSIYTSFLSSGAYDRPPSQLPFATGSAVHPAGSSMLLTLRRPDIS